jgi:hypothetical protein
LNTDYLQEILDLEGIAEGNINERMKAYLVLKGYPQQLNEAWYYALRSVGGTGNLTDMFFQAIIGQIDISSIGGQNRFLTSLGEPVITSDGNNFLV